jgi:hypothetical protein
MPSGEGLSLVAASVSRRVTAVDMVRATLRSAILRGDLPGDARLIQTEIASQLGVSTLPCAGDNDLASDGLITLDSHRIGTMRKPGWANAQIVEYGTTSSDTPSACHGEDLGEEMDEPDLAEELSRRTLAPGCEER